MLSHLTPLLWGHCCFAGSHFWEVMVISECHHRHPWLPAPSLLLLHWAQLLTHWRPILACLGVLRRRRRRMARESRSRYWRQRWWGDWGKVTPLRALHPWWSKVRIGFASCLSFSSLLHLPLPPQPPLLRSQALSWRTGGVCSQWTHRGSPARWLCDCENSHTVSRLLEI